MSRVWPRHSHRGRPIYSVVRRQVPERAKLEVQPTLLRWAWIGVALVVGGMGVFYAWGNYYYSAYHLGMPYDAKVTYVKIFLGISLVSAVVALSCFFASLTKFTRFIAALITLATNLALLYGMMWINAWI